MWVTIFALLVFVVYSVLGLMLMFGQSFGQDLKPWVSISWGGQTLGLGLAVGVAVFLKSPTAYIAAFVSLLGGELGNLMGELSKSDPKIAVLVGTIVFLIAGVLGIVTANKARKAAI